jgi:hypothetical protein
VISMIDGRGGLDHLDLAGKNMREVSGKPSASYALSSSAACLHGTLSINSEAAQWRTRVEQNLIAWSARLFECGFPGF